MKATISAIRSSDMSPGGGGLQSRARANARKMAPLSLIRPASEELPKHPYLVAKADQSAREREHRGNVAAELGRNKQEPAMLCHRITPNPAEAFQGLSNLALMHKTEIRLKHSRLGRWLDSPREMRRDFMR
jgi:hypothetical protein